MVAVRETEFEDGISHFSLTALVWHGLGMDSKRHQRMYLNVEVYVYFKFSFKLVFLFSVTSLFRREKTPMDQNGHLLKRTRELDFSF